MSTAKSRTILICYDGSEHAAHAIAVAGVLFPGSAAKVLHIWEPIEHIVARYAVLASYIGEQIPEADAGAKEQSGGVADRGVALARDAGLDASAHSVMLSSTTWEGVIEAASELGADVIVTGSRSLHGIHEAVVGTLSHALLQHSPLPVLAVPMPHEK